MKGLIEGLVFASNEPVSALQIKTMVEETSSATENRTLETAEIDRTVEALNADYAAADRPYRIIAVAGGYQFATLPAYAAWISRLYRDRMRRKLSQSALESLAIIAYKQPISKPEIEQIRGVNCDYVLKALLEKELVTITGRAETVGRPLLYGTTKEFLKHFGLNSITDLPRPREIEEILGENQFETERRMLEAQEAAEAQRREADDYESRLPHIPKRKPEIPEDVEIVPKKRVRQIRVRPQAQEGAAELPLEHRAELTPPGEPEAAETVSMALPEVPAGAEQADVAPFEPAAETAPLVEPAPVEFASEMPAPVETALAEPEPELPAAAEPTPEEPVTEMPLAVEAETEQADADRSAEVAPDEPLAVPEPAMEFVIRPEPLVSRQPAETAPAEPAHTATDRTVKPPLAAMPAGRTSPQEGPPTLWKSWKEKIQTFIRKLFG